MPTGPAGQPKAATGRSAPRTATAMIHPAHHAAGVATIRPSGSATRPTTPPASPRTVAGPTAGAASRFAPTATRLTCPEIAATSGVQAIWAASGTDTASATHRGSQRISRSRHPGASQRIPAVARTESAKPRVCASQGSKSSSRRTAAPSARVPRRRPWWPIPISPTAPMAAARTTLGSVRARSTKPTTPSAPTTASPRARTPAQRASSSIEPTTRVRLVPETASRWVSPEVRKSSLSASGIAASSPSTRAGTSARGPGGWWATASRIEARRRSAERRNGPGCSMTVGGPRGLSTPARSLVRDRCSRPLSLSREPRSRRCQRLSAITSTGTRTRCRCPRPVTVCVRARKTTYSSNRPGRSTGSEVTTISASTDARSPAKASTALSCTASARSRAEAATPQAATSHATWVSTCWPRRRRSTIQRQPAASAVARSQPGASRAARAASHAITPSTGARRSIEVAGAVTA